MFCPLRSFGSNTPDRNWKSKDTTKVFFSFVYAQYRQVSEFIHHQALSLVNDLLTNNQVFSSYKQSKEVY